MVITDDCISCNACIDECPNNAIYYPGTEYELDGKSNPALSDDHPYVVQELCDNCKNCMDVCPTDCIIE